MYATPRTRPRLFMAGRLSRHRRAIQMDADQLGQVRHRMAGAAMKAAVDGLLSVALMYAQVARAIDKATGSPYALSEADWTALLTVYAQRSS